MVNKISSSEIVLEKIQTLASFRENIFLWCNGQSHPSQTKLLQFQIQQNIQSVRGIIEETRCLKLISLRPANIGRPTVRDYDPFISLLDRTYAGVPCIPAIVEMIDNAIDVLKSPNYLARIKASSKEN